MVKINQNRCLSYEKRWDTTDRESNCTETERTSLKKAALKSMDSLRRIAKPEHQGKFEPQIDDENGKFVFNFMSDDTMEKITPGAKRNDDNNVDDDVDDIRSFETFENSATRSHWENMHVCFDPAKTSEAIRLFGAAYESTSLSDRISAFGKLSELANAANKDKFQIKIKDSETCAAKISCCVGRDVVFHDSAKPGEDLAKCLVDCPRSLFGGEQPKGPSAKMMFWLGKLSRKEFDTIFTEFNRRPAVATLNDMCRGNSRVTEVNIKKLFNLSDKRGTESAPMKLDANIKMVFNLNDAQIAAPTSSASVSENEKEEITKVIIPRLDRMLNQVFSKAQLTGPTNLLAKRSLDSLMNEIFLEGKKYSKQARNLIGNHLKEPAKNHGAIPNLELEQAYVDTYFKGES